MLALLKNRSLSTHPLPSTRLFEVFRLTLLFGRRHPTQLSGLWNGPECHRGCRRVL